MPEGDTVWLHAQRLREALAGRELTVSQFRVPQLATASLVGQTVLEVVPRGKHLLIRLSGGGTLHTHLRMDGSWRVYDAGARWIGGPGWQIRLVLGNAEKVAVGYRIPVIELVPTGEEHLVVGHLGPDLLADDFNPDEAVRRLAADPSREVGVALLNQRCVAGIGNLYRVEVLFLAGVTPWTAVSDVDLDAVVERAAALMRANLGGWSQVTTGSRRRGEEHWVFERAGRPCRRCGSTVLRADQGTPPQARVTYWCPRCQVGPVPPPRLVSTSRGPDPRRR